jgi:hypothetical protein
MGLMSILGAGGIRQVGEAVGGVAEVFAGNRAERDADASRQALATVAQYGAEFAQVPAGRWDGFVNGLNRLPRPLLALGTLGLFAYAMTAPAGFSIRMQGLQLVPEPLWWLLGAIVSFYFGARELHHQRTRTLPKVATGLVGARSTAPEAKSTAPQPVAAAVAAQPTAPGPAVRAVLPAAIDEDHPDHNAAVAEWRQLHGLFLRARGPPARPARISPAARAPEARDKARASRRSAERRATGPRPRGSRC